MCRSGSGTFAYTNGPWPLQLFLVLLCECLQPAWGTEVILGGTGLKHQWDYTRNEHHPEYPYSDVITWHGKLPAQSGFAPTLPRRAADLRKSWDLFLGWFSWVWLRAKLHSKAELSVLLLFKHNFKKLTALSFMSRPCLWNSFKSITREQRDPWECGVPGSAVSPSQTVNSQKDPGTKPTSSGRHRKADKDVRRVTWFYSGKPWRQAGFGRDSLLEALLKSPWKIPP